MSEESKLVYSSEWKQNKTKYSLALTEDEWILITCTLWLDHQFKFAEEIERKLKNKYPEIYLVTTFQNKRRKSKCRTT